MEVINDQKKRISMLEYIIAIMESHISQLHTANDGNEQYQHRHCLRIIHRTRKNHLKIALIK